MPKFPKIRVTIELLDNGPDNRDRQVSVYAFDRGRIAGDVWLNEMTRKVEFEVESGELHIGVGHEAGQYKTLAFHEASKRVDR